jgi:3-dehydroquinate dehydratase-2
MKLLVINGPNLNMLGVREPEIYGRRTLAELEALVRGFCGKRGIEVEFFQSNHEGAIVDKIQAAYKNADGIIINPAAYTHTSIAIPDAIKAVGLPAVEVHLSDISAREEFRRVSYTAPVCIKTIAGKHFEGYIEAAEVLEGWLNSEEGEGRG